MAIEPPISSEPGKHPIFVRKASDFVYTDEASKLSMDYYFNHGGRYSIEDVRVSSTDDWERTHYGHNRFVQAMRKPLLNWMNNSRMWWALANPKTNLGEGELLKVPGPKYLRTPVPTLQYSLTHVGREIAAELEIEPPKLYLGPGLEKDVIYVRYTLPQVGLFPVSYPMDPHEPASDYWQAKIKSWTLSYHDLQHLLGCENDRRINEKNWPSYDASGLSDSES